MRYTVILTILALGAAGVGCGTQVIPRVAVQGTTVAILIPPAFNPGFGRAAIDPDDLNNTYLYWDPKEDPQRGELIMELVNQTTQDSWFLEREWMTRIRPDNVAPVSLTGDENLLEGQVIAFVKIPEDATPGTDYRIYLKRYRRHDSTGVFEPMSTIIGGGSAAPWTGWAGANSEDGIPIEIQAGPGERFTERLGWGRNTLFGPDTLTEADFRDLTPYPALYLEVREEGSGAIPAAIDLVIEYPREKLGIRGVSAYRNQSNRTFVSWKAETSGGQPDDPDASVSCLPGETAEMGTLRIQVLDPDSEAKGFLIAFSLRPENFLDQDCGGRAVVGDFQINTATGYDSDGLEIQIETTALNGLL